MTRPWTWLSAATLALALLATAPVPTSAQKKPQRPPHGQDKLPGPPLTPAEQKKVQTYVKDSSVLSEVQNDVNLGTRLNVNSTPTLFMTHGAQRYPLPWKTAYAKLAALAQGIHLLLVDLQPLSPRDPQGIHGALWEQLTGVAQEQPPDKPLTLAAYDAGPPKVAYVEPVAVGDVLPAMPLFLAPEQYIDTPLEPTYRAAYKGLPAYYRTLLERPAP